MCARSFALFVGYIFWFFDSVVNNFGKEHRSIRVMGFVLICILVKVKYSEDIV